MWNKKDYTEINNEVSNDKSIKRNKLFSSLFSWSFMVAVIALFALIFYQGDKTVKIKATQMTSMEASQMTSMEASQMASMKRKEIPMPSGVNIGSWLSLEDYFFAGQHNSIEVATPGTGKNASKVAACLPPLHVGSTTGPKWFSETDLFMSVYQQEGLQQAIEVFQAHRSSFFGDSDLSLLQSMGIKSVRLPISWCLTDYDPRRTDLSRLNETVLLERFVCRDPFIEGVLWPAVPKPFLEDFLQSCFKHGITVSLDVHTLPGGTSIGTFSGVWPHWPRFWTHGGDGVAFSQENGFDIGHVLFAELIEWIEALSINNPQAFRGIKGLSPMNEPAHLAGNFHVNDTDNFLPPLPHELNKPYLGALLASTAKTKGFGQFDQGLNYPNGTHLRVFYWFQSAIEMFRQSKLPELGIELHVNIHESIFKSLSDDDALDSYKRLLAIASWWCADSQEITTTSKKERSTWAVLDIHHYNAWSYACSGTIDGQGAGYACGDVHHRNEILKNCSKWANLYRDIIDQQCSSNAKLMSGEFSAASHHSVRRSCNGVDDLKESYEMQVNAARRNQVDMYYWSFHMPYGGTFRRAWSFRQLMYNLGIIDRPDEPQFDCDSQQVPDPELPHS